MSRINYWMSEDKEEEVSGITVSEVKKLLREKGGSGLTCHIDRDGCIFETSKIEPKGNNSKFKYNRHL